MSSVRVPLVVVLAVAVTMPQEKIRYDRGGLFCLLSACYYKSCETTCKKINNIKAGLPAETMRQPGRLRSNSLYVEREALTLPIVTNWTASTGRPLLQRENLRREPIIQCIVVFLTESSSVQIEIVAQWRRGFSRKFEPRITSSIWR